MSYLLFHPGQYIFYIWRSKKIIDQYIFFVCLVCITILKGEYNYTKRDAFKCIVYCYTISALKEAANNDGHQNICISPPKKVFGRTNEQNRKSTWTKLKGFSLVCGASPFPCKVNAFFCGMAQILCTAYGNGGPLRAVGVPPYGNGVTPHGIGVPLVCPYQIRERGLKSVMMVTCWHFSGGISLQLSSSVE